MIHNVRTWLPVEGQLVTHRKTKALARLWHCHPYTVVGFLVAVWHYCLEFQSDGRLSDVHDADLREMAGPCTATAIGTIPDVREAMLSVGLLDADGLIHDWQDYAGAVVARRERDRVRKQEKRAVSAGRPADVSRTSAYRAEQSRAEQSRTTAAAAREHGADRAESPAVPPQVHTYAQACVIAANRALEVRLAGGYRPLVASVEAETARAWETDGVPVAVAVEAITAAVERFRITGTSRQPHGLRYFDRAVREAHERQRAAVPSAAKPVVKLRRVS